MFPFFKTSNRLSHSKLQTCKNCIQLPIIRNRHKILSEFCPELLLETRTEYIENFNTHSKTYSQMIESRTQRVSLIRTIKKKERSLDVNLQFKVFRYTSYLGIR